MRVFRYDKKRNAFVVQSVIMIVIAFAMFFCFYYFRQLVYLVLLAFAMVFVAIYFYRMFLMRVVFDDDSVTFKGFAKQIRIDKKNIFDINILVQAGRDVLVQQYQQGNNYSNSSKSSYVLIRANDKPINKNLSMFNAATEDYISLEYVKGIEPYLNKLLDKDNL